MAQGISRVTDLSSYFNNIYEDTVFVAREQTIATRLVKVFSNGRGDQTRTNSTYPEVTASSVAETEDFANPTRFGKSELAVLTPGEVMAQIMLSRRRMETDPDNARGDAATELGAALAKKIDTDILSNAASLTAGTIGGSGSAATWGQFFAALSLLRGGNVPPPYYAVLHPYQYYQMGTAVSAQAGVSQTNAPDFQDTVMKQFWVSRVGGVDIFLSNNVYTSSTDAYGCMFNPNAMAFDSRRGITLEPEYDASKRAWELNCHALYAHGIWRPLWGVTILSDASTPTG